MHQVFPNSFCLKHAKAEETKRAAGSGCWGARQHLGGPRSSQSEAGVALERSAPPACHV